MENCGIIKFYKLYIKGTDEKALVVDKILLLCNLKKFMKGVISTDSHKVYISARCLKHLYDKRPAQEFESLLKYAVSIVKFPDNVYENKESKKGGFCFVKRINEMLYLCSLEVSESEIDLDSKNANYVVTLFKLRDEKYLKNYKLLWSWKGGSSSS